MRSRFLLPLLLVGLQFAVTTLGAARDRASTPRAYHEILNDIRLLMRQEATATSNEAKAQAIYGMTKIYDELMTDPRLATSTTLQKYKARLWGRLTKVKREIERKLARDERLSDSPHDSPHDSPVSVDPAVQSLAQVMELSGASLGGPAQLLSQAAGARGGGAAPPDYGPALVSLIERTITPDFWQVNGGPGVIVYYRPLMVLVVSATSEVHERLGGVVEDLRADR